MAETNVINSEKPALQDKPIDKSSAPDDIKDQELIKNILRRFRILLKK